MSSATKTSREITQLAELVGAVAEQVRTAKLDTLRFDLNTLAEVVGATSESLRIFSEGFAETKTATEKEITGTRETVAELGKGVAGKLDALASALEQKRAELSATISQLGSDSSGLRESLGTTAAKLAEVESTVSGLPRAFSDAVEKAKFEIGEELANKVNASDLTKFKATSIEQANKLAETVEVMRRTFGQFGQQTEKQFAQVREQFAATDTPITFGGIWESGREYPRNCVVSFVGGLYVSIRATSGKPGKRSPDWFAIISFRGGGGGGGGDSLPNQSGQGGKFLKTDGTSLTWAAIAGGGDMLAANNLSDVSNAATAFGNIKQNATTTYSGVVTLATDGGTTAGSVVQATDSRLTDARTPTAHATSHKRSGSDVIKVDEFDWPTDITTLNVSTTAHGFVPKATGSTTAFLRADGTWATPAAGGNVGTDVIWDAKGDLAVGTGADTAVRVPIGADGKYLKASSGDTAGVTWATIPAGGDMLAANNLSDVSNAATAFANIKQNASTTYAGVVTLAASGGVTAGTVVQATDSRLTDSRTPTAHATSHKAGGSDAIALDELGWPTDIISRNASTTAHGLLPKLSGTTTGFLRGDGTWAVPAGGSVGTDVIWDAKGDLAVGTGADTAVRVPIGADGKYLKASSADAAGVTWGTIAGGGDLLAANNLSDVSDATTAFNNIKQLSTTVYSGVVTLAPSGSTTAGLVVQANDSRLTDARTPTAHATSHKRSGSDVIRVDEFDWPTDITTLNVSTTAHGFVPKATGSTTAFLRADGTWATPAGSGDVGTDVIWDAKGDLAVGTGTNTAIRVPVGADGTFLKASSSDAAGVTWAAQSASGGGSKTLRVFSPYENQPPSVSYATLDTRNSIAVLDFDDTSEESAIFSSVIPEGAAMGSGIAIRLHWMATTATGNTCRWGVQFERMGVSDEDTDSWDSATEVGSTATGTSGIVNTTLITATTIDSVTAGDPFRFRVYRDVTDAADTMTGDAELVAVELRSAT